MLVEIYIETSPDIYERLDMFDDENVNINYKLKDLSDIAKIFSTYSQTFTVPASSKNSKILNFIFNSTIIGNSYKYIRGKIYINSYLFKVGFFEINNGKFKDRKISSYTINFRSGVSDLKTILGEKMLSDLNGGQTIKWNDQTVYDILSNPQTQDVLVPLISNQRVWTYGDGQKTDIKFNSSTKENYKYIDVKELRPAIPYSTIMDAVIDQFGLDVRCPLFDRPAYQKLYVHLTNENPSVPKIVLPIDNGFGGYENILGNVTKRYDIFANTVANVIEVAYSEFPMNPLEEEARLKIDMDISQSLTTDDSVKAVFTFLNDSTGEILYTEETTANNNHITSTFDIGKPPKYNIRPGNSLFIRVEVKFSSNVTWNNCQFNMIVKGFFITGERLDLYQKRSQNNLPPPNFDELNLFGLIPNMKIIDFLSSFFKMFNIRVREDQNSFTLNWETPEDFYESPLIPSYQRIKDYTKYTDSSEHDTTMLPVYTNYIFSHKQPKYDGNVAFKTANVDNPNSKEYGQLIYTIPDSTYTKEEYKIETQYSIVPITIINNTNVITYYGFSDGDKKDSPVFGTLNEGAGAYPPNYGEFTLYYKNNLEGFTDENGNPITFGYSLGANTVPLNNYTKFNLTDTDNEATYTNSLGFKDEVNLEPVQFVADKNLFSNYYMDSIQSLGEGNTFSFYYDFTCILPPKEIINFDLRSRIIIGNQNFRIEEASLNIVTGKSTLKLINIPAAKEVIQNDFVYNPSGYDNTQYQIFQ